VKSGGRLCDISLMSRPSGSPYSGSSTLRWQFSSPEMAREPSGSRSSRSQIPSVIAAPWATISTVSPSWDHRW